MTSKERISLSINHQQPDRIPLDIGGSGTSGIHAKTIELLRSYYNLPRIPVKAFEPYQMLGWMEEDIMDFLDIDVQAIPGRETMFGFENENWKKWKMDIGLEVLVSEHFKTTRDDQGNTLIYPKGDTNASPSGKMPKNGYFFDSIIRQEAIIEENLNPEDNLEEYKPIEARDLQYWEGIARQYGQSSRSLLASFGGTALGDIALVPAPFLTDPKGIRDVTEWYMSTLIRQDYIHEVFTKQTEIALNNLSEIFKIVGNQIDVVFICGTDFGTQTSTFCSPEVYRSLYHPYYLQINQWIHKNTNWKTFKHSCGAVADFIPMFIESEFDILNPVQISATGMDPAFLKKEYGNEIVFWGGGIDTQQTLPFGTPKEIRTEVLKNCEIFSRDGGFVFNTVHNIQGHTPIENVVAMLDAVREFNGQKPLKKLS
ncbi:MAG: methyltransferase [Bacteroidales bacterium]|nr:methyltransferase [Bacteroidales bacterium]